MIQPSLPSAGVLTPWRIVSRHPATMARFGRYWMRSLERLTGGFADEPARALLAPVASATVPGVQGGLDPVRFRALASGGLPI